MLNRGSAWIGIVLIVLGSMFLLDTIGVVSFHDIFHNFWPLLLVLLGIALLLRRDVSPAPPSGPPLTGADRVDRSNVFGDIEATVQSQNFSGGVISNVFGDVELDASRSVLGRGEHELNISGVFGDITVKLPPGTAFSVHASLVAGDIRVGDQRQDGFAPTLNYETPGYATADARVRCKLSQVFGEIRLSA